MSQWHINRKKHAEARVLMLSLCKEAYDEGYVEITVVGAKEQRTFEKKLQKLKWLLKAEAYGHAHESRRNKLSRMMQTLSFRTDPELHKVRILRIYTQTGRKIKQPDKATTLGTDLVLALRNSESNEHIKEILDRRGLNEWKQSIPKQTQDDVNQVMDGMLEGKEYIQMEKVKTRKAVDILKMLGKGRLIADDDI